MAKTEPASAREDFISPQTAMARYDLAYSIIRQWATQGRLKAYNMGGRMRIRVSDLEAMLEPIN